MPNLRLKILKYARFSGFVNFFLYLCTWFKLHFMAKKILFINQEIVPYVPDSNLSLMGKALPQAILEKGHEIRTFMPKWGNINERRGQLHEVIRLSGMNLIIDDTDHPLIIKVATIAQTRIQVYFIDNDDYFSKRQMVGNEPFSLPVVFWRQLRNCAGYLISSIFRVGWEQSYLYISRQLITMSHRLPTRRL